MEDAVEALYMAAAVLLLLIALTVSISSFTKAKVKVEQMNEAETGIDLAKDDTGQYINYMSKTSGNRIVGADTVISTIRRISRESYTIYISGEARSLATAQDSGFEKENEFLKLGTAGTNYKNLNNQKIAQIYNAIKNHTYEEKIGIYQENTATGVATANKQTHRIITYIQQ